MASRMALWRIKGFKIHVSEVLLRAIGIVSLGINQGKVRLR